VALLAEHRTCDI